MKEVKFKEANDSDGTTFRNPVANLYLKKFKLTRKERWLLFFGSPLWVATPIRGGRSVFLECKKSAFITKTKGVKKDEK